MPPAEDALWIVMCEVAMEKGDVPDGDTIGFMNIVTWAHTADSAREKIVNYFRTFRWELVSVERSNPVDEDATYSEEITDMIERARGNKMAIILGTYFSYKPH
jgi:hypothetical protein